jgi:hypothetical protein
MPYPHVLEQEGPEKGRGGIARLLLGFGVLIHVKGGPSGSTTPCPTNVNHLPACELKHSRYSGVRSVLQGAGIARRGELVERDAARPPALQYRGGKECRGYNVGQSAVFGMACHEGLGAAQPLLQSRSGWPVERACQCCRHRLWHLLRPVCLGRKADPDERPPREPPPIRPAGSASTKEKLKVSSTTSDLA